MSPSTPVHALRNNAHRLPALDTFQLRGGFNNLCGNEPSPFTHPSPRMGKPSLSTLAPSPPSACSPSLSSVKTKANRLSPVPRQRSTTQATPDVVTHFNFQAHYHRRGDCLAHPSGWGCECERVQQPTIDSGAAWQVLANRFKAVYPPAASPPSPSAGANAPLHRQQSDPLPHRANTPRAHRADKVLSSLPAKSTGPAVLVVPSYIAMKLKFQAEQNAIREKPTVRYDMLTSAAPRHGGAGGASPRGGASRDARDARDLLPASRAKTSRLRTFFETGPRSC